MTYVKIILESLAWGVGFFVAISVCLQGIEESRNG